MGAQFRKKSKSNQTVSENTYFSNSAPLLGGMVGLQVALRFHPELRLLSVTPFYMLLWVLHFSSTIPNRSGM